MIEAGDTEAAGAAQSRGGYTALDSDLPPRFPPLENTFTKLYRPCATELLGTMFFVFVGTMSVYGAGHQAVPVTVAAAHGLTITLLIVGLGHIR